MTESIHVLLVDDDEDDFRLAKDLLLEIPNLHLTLDWVSTFEQAVEEMQRARHDVFLIDFRLGKSDGLQLLSQFAHSRVPIIMLTSEDDREIDLKAMQLGAMDYLVKGRIEAPLLERSIRYSIERKRTEEQLREAHERLEERVKERTSELTHVNNELELAAGRAAFLAEAARILATSLDFQTTLTNMARIAAAAFRNAWCLIDIVHNGRIERVEIAHENSGLDASGRRYTRKPREFDSNTTIARVIRTGKSEIGSVTAAMLNSAVESSEVSGEEMSFARDQNLKSFMTVPLICRGQTLGTLTFATSHAGYSEADLRHAELLADRAAVALDNSRLYTELQQSDRLKDEFLATMSHELRTPLTPILGWSRMLKNRSVETGQLHQALDAIERNAELEARLVDDILDASRIISGKLKLEFELISISDILRLLMQSWKPVAEVKGITLVSDFQQVPRVWGNTQRLHQIFSNLVSNSFKFTPSGGRVAVSVRSTGTNVQVEVSDTGIGITPDFLPHVFERFRQADGSTTRKHGGLGLGLAIVQHLVEMHDGTVTAKSEGPGNGATFTVTLPIATARTA